MLVSIDFKPAFMPQKSMTYDEPTEAGAAPGADGELRVVMCVSGWSRRPFRLQGLLRR